MARSSQTRARRRPSFAVSLLFLVALFGTACGVSNADARGTTVAPTSTARTVTPEPAAESFDVDANRSLVTVRVREQLAGLSAPNDAVLTTSSIDGAIALDAEGIVARGSAFTVDLRTLQSDEGRRDGFVKTNTLETGRYPTATFTVTGVSGLPAPLPETGTWQFDLAGTLSLHGVEREVTWKATATRSGDEISGTAVLTVRFEDFGMETPKAAVVLSVQDEIRIEVELTAVRQTA